ncbi:MAG: phytoene/squalene synthase family protein [Methanobacteriaceae archaeon]|nr:phytoene/squalene synthase family protein [Methanobacteriaceae archaeon]
MINSSIYSIFKRGSKTYFYSTIFFPKPVKNDVFILYSFLRKADDYVDDVPQDAPGFYAFKKRYQDAKEGILTGDVVVDSFVELANRRNFNEEWVDAFLNSMEMDITKSTYKDMDELMTYLYGSSEVVGLFMARVMGLSEESYDAARHLGRAMQYINFIRDISEDLELGRIYFPQEDLKEFGLTSLDPAEAKLNPTGFKSFINRQLDTYLEWQAQAEAGFKYIPYRYLIPVKTASDLYKWTGNQIRKNPLVVYQRKVKPSLPKIVSRVFSNSVRLGLTD